MLRRLVVMLAALAAAAPSAQAAGPETTRTSLQRQMEHAGAFSGGLVVDLDTGEELLGSRADQPLIPASVQKLYTTSAALVRFGAAAQLQTTVLAETPLLPDGVLDGDLFLKGGGDPTLAAPGLEALANQLVAAGLTHVKGRVVGDETRFDDLRGPPSSHFRTSAYVGPLSALSFNRGRTGARRPWFQPRPAQFAAEAFARVLRRAGVRLNVRGKVGAAPEFATRLASFRSPEMAEIARRANVPSDNFIAETLVKDLGAEFGAGGTTRAGALVVKSTAESLGAQPRIADGSGLSRSNRTSPRQVVTLLQGLSEHTAYAAFHSSLAVAGRTGTLSSRLRRSAARDRCRGKTGTLRSVSALAGYCQTRGGALVAYAFLMNRVSYWGARTLQDRMLDAIARYAP